MEDQRWLRLITIGLVLAAAAFGYFLISGRFAAKPAKTEPEVIETVESPVPSEVLGEGTQVQPTTPPAYTRIVERTKGGVQTLPKTGSPTFLIGTLSLGILVAGLGLRKFPH